MAPVEICTPKIPMQIIWTVQSRLQDNVLRSPQSVAYPLYTPNIYQSDTFRITFFLQRGYTYGGTLMENLCTENNKEKNTSLNVVIFLYC